MSAAAPSPMLLACLCAAWCKTCDAYRETFAALAAAHPELQCVWVDIEDHADALEASDQPVPDIENFPTLLLVQDGAPRFFGTVLPHAAVAERLVTEAQRAARPALGEPPVRALTQAVLALAEQGAVGL